MKNNSNDIFYNNMKNDGYCTIRCEENELNLLENIIKEYRSSMLNFYNKDIDTKNKLNALDFCFHQEGYSAGYWPSDVFDDIYEKVNFSSEIYNSQVYESSNKEDFLLPDSYQTDINRFLVDELPHEQAFSIISYYVSKAREIISIIDNDILKRYKIYPQIKSIYYKDKAIVNWHHDKAMFEILVGPVEDFYIDTNGITKKITLEAGSAIFYTGLQFSGHSEVHSISPLLHCVDSEIKDRMSIIISLCVKEKL